MKEEETRLLNTPMLLCTYCMLHGGREEEVRVGGM